MNLRPSAFKFRLLVALALCAAACSSTGGPPVSSQELPTGSFVGRVAGSEAFVAVELEGGQAGQPTSLQAYVSDGVSLLEWFEDDITSPVPMLLSRAGVEGASTTGGATLMLDLDQDGLLGTLFTADGGLALDLQAGPASGVAGLYHFTIDDAGHLTGATSGGATVEGTYSQESETGAWMLSATFTPVPGEGAAQDLVTGVEDGPVAGNGLLIVLADLRTRSSGRSPPQPIAPGLNQR